MFKKYINCHDCGAKTDSLLPNLPETYDIETDVPRECLECGSSQTDLAVIWQEEKE